jgi:hypothetical protein
MPPSPNRLPDYHFLVISPNLGSEWFFDAARAYWEKFRPIVVSDLELPRLMPGDKSVILTVVARKDTASRWGVSIAQVMPNALFDPIIQDFFEDMKRVLNERAATNQPFGVPLAPTAGPPTPISPTPGAVIGGPVVAPTRPAGGFITATPTQGGPAPTEGATAEPTTPAPTEPPAGPIYPTPGPITGG